jgi:hypothetical protein
MRSSIETVRRIRRRNGEERKEVSFLLEDTERERNEEG